MHIPFQADCHPLLIGSIPMKDHQAATELVLTYTPEIPLWVQLPAYREEGMIPQFLPGMPGLVKTTNSVFIDGSGNRFEADLLAFYEEYLAESAQEAISAASRFALTREAAAGFYVLMDQIRDRAAGLTAVKGQLTGPFTFATGLHDADGRAIFYNEQLRDAAVKLLAMKARWQVQQLKALGKPVVIFFDEPALAAFGSSAFISITREEIATCFDEVVTAVHGEGAIAGIHVCANADWSLLLGSSVDVVSFDAYTYFDKLVLYGAQLGAFLERGGILAWGIVPTLNAEDIDRETAETLTASWWEKAETIEKLGIDRSRLIRQSLITPSCGTGSLDLAHATRVLELTQAVSSRIRKEAGISP
jgi:methionine synthase II (cobalamin-independent)